MARRGGGVYGSIREGKVVTEVTPIFFDHSLGLRLPTFVV
jgi:hypothetical protein